MATPVRAFPARAHRPGPAAVLRRAVLLATSVGVALGVALVPGSAAAEEPATASEAAELMAARGHDLEVVTEQFNEAREQLAALQAQAAEAAAAADQAQAQVAGAQQQVRGVARSAWTGQSGGSLQALLTSDSADEFVDRVSVLDMVADHQNGILAGAVATSEAAAAARATADQAAALAQQTYDAVAGQQAALEAEIAEYRADFDRLSAAERQTALAAAAAAHAETAASRDEREEPAPAAAAPSGPVVGGSGAVQTVLDTAMAQRGKPYVWAAGGPRAFDCSGLTQYAFRAAGISLPHSSRLQAQMGQAVSRANLQPGDLVFFYSPVSHVGIYIGNGQMVHAPTSGDVVKVAPVDAMGGYAGARRIAG
ncbi:C40 family peptidase [Trujillonella endophytica]|uniref:Cell wall-associated hydrolase, NlpC family n=1 Tax=Trujillonella endophytica TaxID=673521 RepID=A0A1H8UCQ3_9ACTN|nr:C40 family peptidase [Trujillella endophytica]SEP01042.1 Cell wall-associated hydrolase, NlpC family [Trujillella endophytica]